MQDFRSKLEERQVDLGLELSVQVLTTGSWPTQVRGGGGRVQVLLP